MTMSVFGVMCCHNSSGRLPSQLAKLALVEGSAETSQEVLVMNRQRDHGPRCGMCSTPTTKPRRASESQGFY